LGHVLNLQLNSIFSFCHFPSPGWQWPLVVVLSPFLAGED
jgi:hypothetical protein